MSITTSVNLAKPCTVASDQLIPILKGKYCSSCEKQVVDYTSMSDRELIRALRQNPTGCGSFRSNQLDRPLIENELVRRGYSLAAIALLLALQFCSLNMNAQSASAKAYPLTPATELALVKTETPHTKTQQLTVVDELGQPLAFATVAILNEGGDLIGGETTDTSGIAGLSFPQQAASIRVSYIGHQHQELLIEELGPEPIELFSISSHLPEVIVTAANGTLRGLLEFGSYGYSINQYNPQNLDAPTTTASKFNLFPNPSSGQSTLSGELLQTCSLVNVYSATGQLVLSIPLVDDSTTSLALQLADHYPSGNYIVELLLKNGSTEVTKWMVAR